LAAAHFLPFFQDVELFEIADQRTGGLVRYIQHFSYFYRGYKRISVKMIQEQARIFRLFA
jgi:hypothetical protein